MEPTARGGLRSVLSVCPYCACGCGLYLQGTDRGLVGVGPSVHHPVSQGRLCARGWGAHEATVWGARLATPLVRREGELEPATWPEALRAAANALRVLRDSGRPLGVLGSGRATNEENFLALTLARLALGSGQVDAGLGGVWDTLLAGFGERQRPLDLSQSLHHLERSELILVVEGDLAVSHPRLALAVMRAKQRGGRLVTLSWAPTQLSALASLHFPLRTDAPLSGLAQLRVPLAERTDARRARPSASAEEPAASPEVRLAGWLAESRRTTFLITPFERDPAALLPTAAGLRELAQSLARAGRPEPLLLPVPLRANTRGAHELGVVPDLLPGRRPLTDLEARERLQDLWGSAGSWERGRPVEEFLKSGSGLVVLADDLPSFHTSPRAARAALERLSCLVVLDSVMTETAQHAHVVLPIAGFGEQAGTCTNFEGRVQALRAWGEPPGAAQPGWQVLAQLLAALDSPWVPDSLEAVRTAIARAVPGYPATPPADADWGALLPVRRAPVDVPAAGGTQRTPQESAEQPSPGHRLLRRDGAFDWAEDPLVQASPTLRRDGASRARLQPNGVVAMNPEVAAEYGVRDGWRVTLRSAHGEAQVPVTLRAGLDPDVLLVPFAFREQLAAVLGDGAVADVEVVPTR